MTSINPALRNRKSKSENYLYSTPVPQKELASCYMQIDELKLTTILNDQTKRLLLERRDQPKPVTVMIN